MTSLQNKVKFLTLSKPTKKQLSVVSHQIFFNWRIIALQNFVVFCHTSTRISHRYTHVPFLPDLPPVSRPTPPFSLSQRPCLSSLSHTANSHWLICFTHGIVNFYVTLSIHLPFSLLSSHLVHRSVLYVCFSIAALKINSSVPSLQIPFICVIIRYLYFSFWLTSLCIMGSSFVHLIRTYSNVFLFMAE